MCDRITASLYICTDTHYDNTTTKHIWTVDSFDSKCPLHWYSQYSATRTSSFESRYVYENVYSMKRSFYRAVNGIFAKLGRLAPEEIILQLICQKWMPILLCGLEVCLLSKRQLMSLDFTVNRVLMNQNIHIDIIQDCRDVLSLNYPVYSWYNVLTYL